MHLPFSNTPIWERRCLFRSVQNEAFLHIDAQSPGDHITQRAIIYRRQNGFIFSSILNHH